MASSWEAPKWRQEGRTGPGPVAPKYAGRKDRATVQKGGKVTNSNPGGPGGQRRKMHTNKPQGKTSHRAGGGGGKKGGCAVAAIALAGGALAVTGGAAYGLVEAVRAVL